MLGKQINIGAATLRRRSILVRWSPPPHGYFKLNTDGSRYNVSWKASAGGIIRNWGRDWVRGFFVNIGKASSFVAELWGLREGLRLCHTLGIRNLHAEMDSATIVHMLQNEQHPNQALSILMRDCHEIARTFHSFTLTLQGSKQGCRSACRTWTSSTHRNFYSNGAASGITANSSQGQATTNCPEIYFVM